MNNKILQGVVLNKIVLECRRKFTHQIFSSFKTVKGLTQESETIYKSHIRAIIVELGYKFTEASSQKTADFRISLSENNEMLLEIKKTSSNCVILNDTCPSEKMCYMFIYTGKNSTFIHGLHGSEMLAGIDHKRLKEYKELIDKCRSLGKTVGGHLSAYTRPNYRYDIRALIEYYKNKKIKKPVVKVKQLNQV